MRFRIYYGDGSTYSGDPYHAPPNNVQCVVQEMPGHERGWVISKGEHETKGSWWWDGEHWRVCDTAGMWDYLLMHVGPKAILFGRTLRDSDHWAIIERANREGLGNGR